MTIRPGALAVADDLPYSIELMRCTADTTRNNSTTLLDATGLSLSLAANATYCFHGCLIYTSGATPDIKFAWTIPSGMTGWWALWPTVQAAAGTVGDVSCFWDTDFGAAQGAGGSDTLSGKCSVLPHGYVVTTNAGTLQVQFAQVTANASNTTVKIGSWLNFTRVA